MTDEQIKYMVDRFLGWRLPSNFSPDAGISFKAVFNEHTAHAGRHEPSGTNLFDATQAEAMVRYLVDGLSAPSATGGETQARDDLAARAAVIEYHILGELEAQSIDFSPRDAVGMWHIDGGCTPQSSGVDIDLTKIARRIAEGEECPTPSGCPYCAEFGCPRLGDQAIVAPPPNPPQGAVEAGGRAIAEAHRKRHGGILKQWDECREGYKDDCRSDAAACLTAAASEWLAGQGMVVVRADEVEQAAAWFDDYAERHQSKGTPDGDRKAQTNIDRAEFVRAMMTGGEAK